MSFFIIQQNVQQIIQHQKRTRVMVSVDCYFQPKPNTHLLSTNLYNQQYSIVIQTKYVQNIQMLFQTQIQNKYIKLKFKPIRILAKSQRSIIQLSNKLQFYNKQNKNHFYKWYLNKNGHLNVQIMYLLQQFLNHLHVQFILDKTIREITDAFQNILVDMLGYLNLENLIESFQEENTQCDTEQQEVKVADKIKYLMLLNQVYKKHRRSQFLFYQLQKDKTKQNQLISKIQAFQKCNILVQDDTSFVQLIQKQKKQYQQRLKSVMKLITPKLNDKVFHLNMYKMYLTQKQFQKYVKGFKKEHLQIYQITNMHFRIVRGIQNQVLISKQNIISSNGSHSDIYLGTYCLQLSETLFTYQHQGNLEEAQKKVVVKPLICKRIKSHEQSASVNSFRNQVMFLHFAKDKRSKFISTYFIPFNKAKDQVSQIYAQFYENNLKEYLEKCKKKSENEVSLFKILDLAQHIILALILLVESGILHRDLKPFNIMIDKSQKARLIDFGSCCPIFNRNEFEAAQKRILTTPAYQIKYRQCPEHVKQKYSKSEYEQHILFDVYSFGVTLKQMIQYVKDLEQVGKKENVNVAQIIDLIVARCKQPDPIERVTFDELLYFIKVLKEIQKNN